MLIICEHMFSLISVISLWLCFHNVIRATVWSDSDDDDAKRIVKSEKDKRFDELLDIIKTSKNYRKIKDLSNTLSGKPFVIWYSLY